METIVEISQLWAVNEQSWTIAAGSCRDAEDDKILALAHSCGADVIVSIDTDLIAMHPWERIDILTPANFLAKAEANTER